VDMVRKLLLHSGRGHTTLCGQPQETTPVRALFVDGQRHGEESKKEGSEEHCCKRLRCVCEGIGMWFGCRQKAHVSFSYKPFLLALGGAQQNPNGVSSTILASRYEES
jgi:hypothetical protein